MIDQLTGKAISVKADSVTIQVSGLGFKVAITPRHSLKINSGQEVQVFTRLIVREDDLSLFGFETSDDQEVFDLLCSVNGIGPKLALTVLAGMEAQDVRNAVNASDDAAFRSISGIGPKTAKLIVISLANKVGLSTSSPRSTVVSALIQLGTDEQLAKEIAGGIDPTLDDSQALKLALANLGKSKLGSA